MTLQAYLKDSYVKEITTYVEAAEEIDGNTGLALADNIYHPTGGGQPSDHGYVTVNGERYLVKNLIKKRGTTFIVIDVGGDISDDVWGQEAECSIDWKRRYVLMRYHTAAHVLMSAARQVVTDYDPKGMNIQDDLSYCEISFSTSEKITELQVSKMQNIALEAIKNDLEVDIKKYKNIDVAREDNKSEFRIDSDLKLKKNIRVIVIDRLDANPCGGTHVKSLGEIGGIEIQSVTHNSNNCKTMIRFSVL